MSETFLEPQGRLLSQKYWSNNVVLYHSIGIILLSITSKLLIVLTLLL